MTAVSTPMPTEITGAELAMLGLSNPPEVSRSSNVEFRERILVAGIQLYRREMQTEFELWRGLSRNC